MAKPLEPLSVETSSVAGKAPVLPKIDVGRAAVRPGGTVDAHGPDQRRRRRRRR